jgi:hypothetical protein
MTRSGGQGRGGREGGFYDGWGSGWNGWGGDY